MDHHGQRPTLGGEDVSMESTLSTADIAGKKTFQANIVSPVEPIGAHGHQQIDAGQPRVAGGRSGRMPEQIDPGRIGLARFVGRDQIIAADVPIRERRGGGLDRTGDAQQAAAGPRPIKNGDLRQPLGGTIGIEGKRYPRQIQASNMAFQEPTLGFMASKKNGTAEKPDCSRSPARKIKTPPLAVKRNGGAGTEKRPNHLLR